MVSGNVVRTYEREAVRSFTRELARRGRRALVVSWPEDEERDPRGLTVDALLDIDGELYAVDHSRVTYGPRVVPALVESDRRLAERLERLAAAHGRAIVVSLAPPDGSPGARDAFLDLVVELAEAALLDGTSYLADDGATSVQLLPTPTIRGGPNRVAIFGRLASTPSVEEQVRSALRAPVEKKLSRQLARARSLGYRAILLLDQYPPPAAVAPSNELAAPATIASVMGDLVVDHPGVLTESWLRDAGRRWHVLTGSTGLAS